MKWLAVSTVCFALALGLQTLGMMRLSRDLSASRAREYRAMDQTKSVVETLNKTTANLEQMTAAVEGLLTEKRAAWGLPPETLERSGFR